MIIVASCTQSNCIAGSHPMDVVSISLVKGQEDYRCAWIQCRKCGHHRAVGIDKGIEITIGEKL